MNVLRKFAFVGLVGFAVAGSVSLLCQAASAAETHIQMKLFCEEQNEGGDDETYVVLSGSDGQNSLLWSGDVADDDENKKRTGSFDVARLDLQPGQSVGFVVSVFEKDGVDYRPGLQAAAEIARAAGSAIAGVPIPDRIGNLSVGSIIDGLGLNSDDYMGSFSVLISADANGNITTEFAPKERSRWLSDGQLRLDGDGARYFPSIFVNGERRLGHDR